MAWPTIGNGSGTKRLAQGDATTLRWGSKEVVRTIDGTATASVNIGIVTRCHEREKVSNLYVENGDGIETGRTQLIQGVVWDVTQRDDSGIGIPYVGATVIIADCAGLISGYTGGAAKYYSAKVIENGYDVAPKEPGSRNYSVEALYAIEGSASV